MMASNAQVTPFGLSMNRFALGKALDQIAKTGRAIPCTVVKVMGSIVQVSFQLTAAPGDTAVTLPNVTIPIIGPEYVRHPIQPGCKGFTVPADYYLGGMSGLGGGVATTGQTGNLTALCFAPVGNSGWFAVNGNILTMYGPDGVTLMDQAQTTFVNLTAGRIDLIAGGKTLTIDSVGITLDGILWETHYHVAPSGGGNTGPPL